MSLASRCAVARRFCAVCLVILVFLPMASPVLAAGPAAPREPAGFAERLVSWIAGLWTSAAGLLDPTGGSESLDGGCGLDPSGSCHSGAVAPPAGEDD